ncbi:MAG: hypothetical protein LBB76_08440, partial [Azoarcus sp.]|nr:hypothetical protein [Azoarcus sp.]
MQAQPEKRAHSVAAFIQAPQRRIHRMEQYLLFLPQAALLKQLGILHCRPRGLIRRRVTFRPGLGMNGTRGRSLNTESENPHA